MALSSYLNKSRFRFNDDYDLHLAREVVGQNPYEEPKRWNLINVNMIQVTGKSVSVRTLKERIQNLVKKYWIKIKRTVTKSGTEEIVTELDDLLQQILELMNEFKGKKGGVKTQTQDKTSFQKGFDAREDCVANMQRASTYDGKYVDINYELTEEADNIPGIEYEIVVDSQVEVKDADEKNHEENYEDNFVELEEHEKVDKAKIITRTPKKRKLAQANILSPSGQRRTYTNIKQSTVQYLTKKNDRQYEIRSKELSLQERKQDLQEKRFEMEVKERQKKMEMEEKRLAFEEKRLNAHLELFDNQQQLIKIILQKNL